jgi:hypothetical protein
MVTRGGSRRGGSRRRGAKGLEQYKDVLAETQLPHQDETPFQSKNDNQTKQLSLYTQTAPQSISNASTISHPPKQYQNKNQSVELFTK